MMQPTARQSSNPIPVFLKRRTREREYVGEYEVESSGG